MTWGVTWPWPRGQPWFWTSPYKKFIIRRALTNEWRCCLNFGSTATFSGVVSQKKVRSRLEISGVRGATGARCLWASWQSFICWTSWDNSMVPGYSSSRVMRVTQGSMWKSFTHVGTSYIYTIHRTGGKYVDQSPCCSLSIILRTSFWKKRWLNATQECR